MKRLVFLLLPFLLFVSSCSNHTNTEEVSVMEEEINMRLEIDNKEIEVTWLDNQSTKALKEILPITINMSRYGGFEQVGSLGQRIVSDDHQLTTEPGDIVLYNSSNIVIFFGNNSWAYTKLGHINLNKNELVNLLDKESVTVKIGE